MRYQFRGMPEVTFFFLGVVVGVVVTALFLG